MSMPRYPFPQNKKRPQGVIPLPRSVGGGRMLWFDRLSSSDGLRGVLTLGWRFKNETDTDPWSARFNRFKFGYRDAVTQAAGAVSVAALSDFAWPDLEVGFTAALSSGGTQLEPTARLARLGKHLARRFGATWHGDILKKEAHPSLHKGPGAASDRAARVRNKYRCVRDVSSELLIVCDDFTTNGDTLSEIARAIHERNPEVEVMGFTLAKTENRTFAQNCGETLDNSHLPQEWADLWDKNA